MIKTYFSLDCPFTYSTQAIVNVSRAYTDTIDNIKEVHIWKEFAI